MHMAAAGVVRRDARPAQEPPDPLNLPLSMRFAPFPGVLMQLIDELALTGVSGQLK